jgi:hypothetical protein
LEFAGVGELFQVVEDIPVFGDKTVVVIFFIFCVEQVIMADIFVFVFGISECGINGWEADVMPVE